MRVKSWGRELYLSQRYITDMTGMELLFVVFHTHHKLPQTLMVFPPMIVLGSGANNHASIDISQQLVILAADPGG